MPRKVFQGFTRLDASDVNTYLMDQSIQVFAGTAARGSAIASPTEGMYSHLNDTDDLEYYDGSAWVNAVPSSGGMDLIVTENFSAVSEVLFTSKFTADYRNYYFTISPLSASVDGTTLSLQLRNGTSNQNAANYQRQAFVSQSTTNTGSQTTNQTSFNLGVGETVGRVMQYYIFDPQGNTNTAFQGKTSRLGTTNQTMNMNDGAYFANYAADGFRVFPASGNITGTISLYGLKD
jgi:hypothetical protein